MLTILKLSDNFHEVMLIFPLYSSEKTSLKFDSPIKFDRIDNIFSTQKRQV